MWDSPLPHFILASKSPRRIELLTMVGADFEVCPADIDESSIRAQTPEETAIECATAKAKAVAGQARKDALVLSCDTVVVVDGEVFGKPADDAHAAQILRALSGRTHTVICGVCLLEGNREKSFAQSTDVTFYPLSDVEIAAYINTGECCDKAGAYGIQGQGSLLVEKIEGDFYNVMGLPLARTMRELYDFVEED